MKSRKSRAVLTCLKEIVVQEIDQEFGLTEAGLRAQPITLFWGNEDDTSFIKGEEELPGARRARQDMV